MFLFILDGGRILCANKVLLGHFFSFVSLPLLYLYQLLLIWQKYNCEKALRLHKQVEDLIRIDNKSRFVSLVRRVLEKKNFVTNESVLDSKDVLMWICSHQALACATALLEGKTGLSVDLNVTLKCGFYPLHYAAENLCCGLTDVFLKHGALTSLPCSVHGSRYSGKLP